MVERINSKDASEFWGCSRFPACRGTRPLAATSPRAAPAGRSKPRLSAGGRPKGWGDYVELALARVTGRNFGVLSGLVLRVVLIGLVVMLAILLIGPVSNWVGRYVAAGDGGLVGFVAGSVLITFGDGSQLTRVLGTACRPTPCTEVSRG